MRKFGLIVVLSLFTAALMVGSALAVNVNNFTITSYDMKFHLSKDSDDRSVLTTQETIKATFPNSNQNHGIERYIPSEYNGHPTSLNIKSVTDASGKKVQHSTYSSGKFTVLRIGNPKRYVHGAQVYKIEYAQRDTTRFYEDTNKDEFYWDTNGTDWRVPINHLTVSLSVDESLREAIETNLQCYQGAQGSSDKCQATSSGEGEYKAEALFLRPGENLTLALGFAPGTFAEYKASLKDRLVAAWGALQMLIVPAAIGCIVWLIISYRMRSNSRKDLGTIVPEYIPPADSSVYVSAMLLTSNNWFAAQLVDLAVRKYLRIYEVSKKGLLSKGNYELEIIKPIDDLKAEEQELIKDVFSGRLAVGSRISTEKLSKDTRLQARLADNPALLKKLMRQEYNLKQEGVEGRAKFRKRSIVIGVIGALLLSPILLGAAALSFVFSKTLWVNTEKAIKLLRYLEGLKMYISVAEKDRLKMLQSPEGASKVQVDGGDPKQLIKLYERVLPYAVLFGQEKQWSNVLGSYYASTNSQPDWYSGATAGAFNAAAFSGAMSSFKTTVTSSAATSSSSGGSSGGGFSGGGGGGGGGGGW